MGFSPQAISRRYDDIAEFSELGDWLERPVRMYSSGMQARLAFSVAVHAGADILLIDEILGVGDYAFRRKCLEHLDRLRTENNTSIILVSHNPYQVQRLCDKALMLDQGKKIRIDNAFKRSEEHTSEFPSLMRIPYDAFCLKNTTTTNNN